MGNFSYAFLNCAGTGGAFASVPVMLSVNS